MASPAVAGSSGRSNRGSAGGSSSSSRHSQGDKQDRRRREKDRERVEKERVRKEHARKVLEEQKINKARRKWQKQSEFLCTIKFRNSLPDPPLGPHFLEVPLDLDRFVKYRPTTLDTDYKWQLHYERDLGVPIDVIDPRNYLLPKNPVPLPKEDEALINWRDGASSGQGRKEDLSTSARRRAVDTSVTWLKKTVYLTNDPFDPVHSFKSEQQAQEDKRKQLEQEMARGSKQDRKTLIEESFIHANSRAPLVHQDTNKRHLTAEWVVPVMPDISLWANTYTTVVFDKDPTSDDAVKGSEARKRKRANDALFCNVKKTIFEGSSHEVITGSYMLPKYKKSKRGDRGQEDDEEEDEDEEDEDGKGEREHSDDGGACFDFIKDYTFNIMHYPQTRYEGNPQLLFFINPDNEEASFCKLSAKVELANLPREHGQRSTGGGAIVHARGLSHKEADDARDKVTADLHLEGEFPVGVVHDNGNGQENGYAHHGLGQEDQDSGGSEEGMGENGHMDGADEDVNGHHGGSESRARNGTASDAERESVHSMTIESEASNVAVKGTESSEGGLMGADTDDNDSEP